MKDPKTTIAGILAALPQAGHYFYPEAGAIFDGVSALGIALLAYFAADSQK